MNDTIFCKAGSRANNFLNEMVDKIASIIIDDFNPEAIIADGSLGKGEITIRDINGDLLLESDFDLQVVTNKQIKRTEMLSYSEKLSERFGFEINIRRTDPRIFGKVSKNDLALSYTTPSISTYERKYCSKIIYGKDFIKFIPEINSSKIPVWEGIRLIMNRIGEFFGSSKSIYINRETSYNFSPLDEAYRKFSYSKNKCVIACMDSILIAHHKYHWSLEKRLETFKDLLNNHKDLLPFRDNQIDKLFSDSINFKFNSQYKNNSISNELMIKLIDESLTYVIRKELNIRNINWLEFPRIWVKSSKVKKEYFRGPTPSLFYQNGIVLAKILLLRKFIPSWRLFTIPHVFWAHLMYGTLPLLLFSIESKNGDYRYLRKVRNNFSKIANLKKAKDDYWKEWDYLSNVGNKIWYTLALV